MAGVGRHEEPGQNRDTRPDPADYDPGVSLAILHREPGVDPVGAGQAIWRTCLREVAFVDDAAASRRAVMSVAGGQRLEDGAAYQLLLEILCGLQSPMIGETQVLGQFKAFLGSVAETDHAWIGRVGQRLLADARDVRTKHLQGLGSRSYGSAVRRDLSDVAHAVVIGTGKLAREVLPFLGDEGRTVDQWGRTHAAGIDDVAGTQTTSDALPRVTCRHLDTVGESDEAPVVTAPVAIVVAAPVSAEVVEAVARRYPGLVRVIDLRADVGERALNIGAEVISLQDLFARMHDQQASALPRIEAARNDIARRTRQYELRDELRPFGWDDLCA
jgi:glutamyl-tRNA reductase